jgi:hypothetical protein
MIEAIASILVSIVEALIAKTGQSKAVSAPRALYLMFLSISSIVDEADQLLSQIEAQISGGGTPKPTDLEERLFGIYRQSQIFLQNASYVAGPRGVVQFFDHHADKLIELSYEYDMGLVWALDAMISTLRHTFRDERTILDFDPMAESALVFHLGTWHTPRAAYLDKIRQVHNVRLISIASPADLEAVLIRSRGHLALLRQSASDLGDFIGKHFTMADFVSLTKNDLTAWNSLTRRRDDEEELRAAARDTKDVEARARTLAGNEVLLRRRIHSLEDKVALLEGRPFIDTLGHQLEGGKCRRCGCSTTFIEYFGTHCRV